MSTKNGCNIFLLPAVSTALCGNGYGLTAVAALHVPVPKRLYLFGLCG